MIASTELDWNALVKALLKDDGSAAHAHLAAGRPIYYRKQDTPEGLVIRESPGGLRELISVTTAGDEQVVSVLP